MNKWIAEFELEDGDTMPEHMDLNYMGAKIDFHCRPMWIPVKCDDAISRQTAIDATWFEPSYTDPLNVLTEVRDRLKALPPVTPQPRKEEIQKRLTNKEWIDFLSEQFDVSRTSAKEMLHMMMSVKERDNFKKQLNEPAKAEEMKEDIQEEEEMERS